MAKSRVKQRIIWAIDPFEEKSDTQNHVLEALKDLMAHGAVIEPVYVLNPDEYNMDIEFNAPWLKHIRPTTQKVLDHYLKDNRLPPLLPPQIIVEKRPSLTRAVRALVGYADRSKANGIIVGSHAKKGMERLFLGSFSETLLLHSKVPALVVGPHSEVDLKTHRGILFPTDFGPSAHATFKQVLALAKARRQNITLFHCLPHPYEPMVQSSVFLLGGGYVSFPDYLTQDEIRKRKVAQKYSAEANKAGVQLDVIFKPGHGNTADKVIETAQRQKHAMIAMAAESGAITAALIGSIARQVVRGSPCPTWVLRH